MSEYDREEIEKRFREHVGKTIRVYREKNNIPRAELADHLGVDSSTLSRYELGTTDIKASTMAVASVACNFPMRKYTDIYDNEPAALVEDFKKLVKIGHPRRKRNKAKQDNRPPKPKIAFNENEWKWEMITSTESIEPSFKLEPEPVSDGFLMEYIAYSADQSKREFLSWISEFVDIETDGGRKKCSKELKALIRASLKYIVADTDKRTTKRLMAYIEQLYG